nr:MAG TPA: SOS-response transcriptional repressor [Caudoviricetes sp.]
MTITNVYENVSALCTKKKKSIRSVEREANLSTGTISKWKTASPTVDNLKAVATVLKVKVDKLLE